jgi:hypothetical protein
MGQWGKEAMGHMTALVVIEHFDAFKHGPVRVIVRDHVLSVAETCNTTAA